MLVAGGSGVYNGGMNTDPRNTRHSEQPGEPHASFEDELDAIVAALDAIAAKCGPAEGDFMSETTDVLGEIPDAQAR